MAYTFILFVAHISWLGHLGLSNMGDLGGGVPLKLNMFPSLQYDPFILSDNIDTKLTTSYR